MTTRQTATSGRGDAKLAPFKDLQGKRLEWLWPGWIPLGKVAILDGDPGLGKSTLLFDLAARVSSGAAMPDGAAGVSGNVIILSAEDDPEDTIKPRLAAAGADESRIYLLGAVDQESEQRPVEIPRDLSIIGNMMQKHDARLLILDPLMAFLVGVDANRDQDARRVLHRLAAIASQCRCAVVCVRHLNKSDGGKAIYRGSSSIGLIGQARTGLLVAQDPDDDTKRILAVSKCNLAIRPMSLKFGLEAQNDVCRISWCGTSPYQADRLVERPPSEEQKERNLERKERERTGRDTLRRCEDFIRGMVGSYGIPRESLKAECIEAGFAERTVQRAIERLGLVSKRQYGMRFMYMPTQDETASA